MSIPELIGVVGGFVSFFAMMVVGLVGVIYRNDREVAKATQATLESRVTALEKQNIEQETRIATITAQITFAREGNDRLISTLDRLDSRLDDMSREFVAMRSEVQNLSRRLTGGGLGSPPGTMPAVRVPR